MRPIILCSALGATLFLSLPAFAEPGNILLARGRTEPVVAVDPHHPAIILAAANTNYSAPVSGTYPTAYFSSLDGGRSFVMGNVPTRWPYTTGADSSITIAASGTAFMAYLGETPTYCSGGRSAVMLTTSIDHGRSFRTPTIVDADPSDDKPYMAVQSVSAGPAHVFLSWTRWHSKSSAIWFARSVDGGRTFGRSVELYGSRLDNFGSVPVVGPHGQVYVFWSVFAEGSLTAPERARIMLRSSTDDGAHFGPPRPVTGFFWTIPRMAAPGSLRNLPTPAAAVDSHGHVFLAWAAATRHHPDGSVDADIELARSTNRGRTWSRPRAVNDVHRSDRFMPSISVLSDGSVGLAFYDRRNSPWTLDVYAVRVSFGHGFQRTRNMRVDRGISPVSDIYYIAPGSTCFSPGRFFGDYIGTAAIGTNLAVVWADTQLHAVDETDLWFAKISLSLAGASRRYVQSAETVLHTRNLYSETR